MKSAMIRFLLLLLTCSLCCGGMLACAAIIDGESEAEKNENEPSDVTQPTAMISLLENGTPKYAIVRSDLSDKNSLEVALSLKLKKALSAVSGKDFELKTDWDNKDDNEGLYEILVGKTNRASSVEIMSRLEGEHEYMIHVCNNKIVIVGNSDPALEAAVEYFLETYVGWRSESDYTTAENISLDATLVYIGEWSLPGLDQVWKGTVACSPNRPSQLLLVDAPSQGSANGLTMGTLQGLATLNSNTQILLRANSWQKYIEYIKADQPEGYGVYVSETSKDGKKWSLSSLLSYYAPVLDGYILCDEDVSSASANVAVNLAHFLNAVVVTPSNEDMALKAGLDMVMDVRGRDDKWFRESEYFALLDTSVAVEQATTMAPKLVDYAVMAGCYFQFYNGTDADAHSAMFDFLDDGAVVIGWNNTLGEHGTVTSFASLNACLVPADHAYNLSTLSGMGREGKLNEAQYKGEEDYTVNDEARHTVCFVMSDGDNLQWVLNDYTSPRWYGSELRGLFPMTWGLPPLVGDLASPMLSYYIDTQNKQDEFIMQLSGLGYTFPSKWDKSERENMASEVASLMRSRGMKYMNILDDKGFNEESLSAFAKQNGIEGIFYTDYENYAGYKGQMLFVDGVPCVSAKYRLWSGPKDGSLENIASSINSAVADVNNPNGYTFIIVHAWSGMDGNGNFAANGNSMQAVDELISMLDADVDIVSASEFMGRIKQYLK